MEYLVVEKERQATPPQRVSLEVDGSHGIAGGYDKQDTTTRINQVSTALLQIGYTYCGKFIRVT